MATLPIRYPDFAGTLTRLMKEKFDTKDLMAATGATFAACKRWENGQAYPRKSALYEIAKLLGVTLLELTGKSDGDLTETKVWNRSKPASGLQVIAKRLDEITKTIEALKRERDELKRQMLSELTNLDTDL